MCTLSSLQPSFSIFPPLFSSLVVCTYIFVPFATVGLYTGSESLFGSDTLAPRANYRQFLQEHAYYTLIPERGQNWGHPLCSDTPQLLVQITKECGRNKPMRALNDDTYPHTTPLPLRAPPSTRALHCFHYHTSNKPLHVLFLSTTLLNNSLLP